MTYQRVIPRDLFNEGDLLNCLGRLWIKLDERRDHAAQMMPFGDDAQDFGVFQDESDGSIAASRIALFVGGELVPLFRPLNARSKWPLWARFGDEDILVFDPDGGLSTEFWVAISQPELIRYRQGVDAAADREQGGDPTDSHGAST